MLYETLLDVIIQCSSTEGFDCYDNYISDSNLTTPDGKWDFRIAKELMTSRDKLIEVFRKEMSDVKGGDKIYIMSSENVGYIAALFKLFDYLNRVVSDSKEMEAIFKRFTAFKYFDHLSFDEFCRRANSILDISHLLHDQYLCKNDLVFIMLLFDNAISEDRDEKAKEDFVSEQVSVLLSTKEPKIQLGLEDKLKAAWLKAIEEKTVTALSHPVTTEKFLEAVFTFINLFAMPLIAVQQGLIEKLPSSKTIGDVSPSNKRQIADKATSMFAQEVSSSEKNIVPAYKK